MCVYSFRYWFRFHNNPIRIRGLVLTFLMLGIYVIQNDFLHPEGDRTKQTPRRHLESFTATRLIPRSMRPRGGEQRQHCVLDEFTTKCWFQGNKCCFLFNCLLSILWNGDDSGYFGMIVSIFEDHVCFFSRDIIVITKSCMCSNWTAVMFVFRFWGLGGWWCFFTFTVTFLMLHNRDVDCKLNSQSACIRSAPLNRDDVFWLISLKTYCPLTQQQHLTMRQHERTIIM